MARVRVRQHVNPLSQKYQQEMELPPLVKIYEKPTQPLHLDIGCARGKFLLQMAQAHPDWNFLGIEIREPLVIEANEQVQFIGLKNLHFCFGNINIHPSKVLSPLAPYLSRVSIQFPDPWFKVRHQKRRVVQPALVQALAQILKTQDHIFLQSDVESVAREMGDRFLENSHFQSLGGESWLSTNPLGIATEREIACGKLNRPVYRLLLTKVKDPQSRSA